MGFKWPFRKKKSVEKKGGKNEWGKKILVKAVEIKRLICQRFKLIWKFAEMRKVTR